MSMTCDSIGKLIPFYFYGELQPEEEERVEAHLHECEACSAELESHRRMAMALNRREAEIPPGLLGECRTNLIAAIEREGPVAEPAPPKSARTLLAEAISAAFAGFGRWRQPLGALALVAVGFFAARFTTSNPGPVAQAPAASAEEVFATVRSVQPDNTGGVRISYDETRRKVLAGPVGDQNVQRLLLAAAREDNPAVRLESVDALQAHVRSVGARDALLNAVAHDPNPGVRMKALEGIKTLGPDSEIRRVLAQVLAQDDYPAVRMQAVDVLVASPDESMVGMLQGLVQRENNNYVRLKYEKALKEMNASIGTF